MNIYILLDDDVFGYIGNPNTKNDDAKAAALAAQKSFENWLKKFYPPVGITEKSSMYNLCQKAFMAGHSAGVETRTCVERIFKKS